MQKIQFTTLFLVTVLGCLLSGCSSTVALGPSPQQGAKLDTPAPKSDAQVNFADPLLNNRTILLFGAIDQRAAEEAIQKLLYLDDKGHEPINLFLVTPGGDMKYAWAIQQTMRLIHARVNTCALSECNSAGVMLLAGGTGERRAFHGAVIVIHGLQLGTGAQKPPPAFVTDLQNGYTDFWRRNAKLPESWLPLPLNSLHILTAEQALEYGIVDEIADAPKTTLPNIVP